MSQDRRLGGFAWEDGEGEIVIRWPKLYNVFRGRKAKDHTVNVREGEYNFESGLSAGRDNQTVQITPFRQAWSSAHLFPMRLSFIEEADQHYVPGGGVASDYWLPSALVQSAYGWKAQASVDDVPCEVYGRADGHDTIWVAQNAGYVVCRREIRDKTGRLIEVVRNSQLKNLAADVWIPTVQLQERYFEDPSVPGWDISKPTCVVKVVVTSVAVGHVDEKRLHIEIPNGARVHNQILDVIYQKGAGSLEFLDSGIKAGRHVMTEAAQERAPARLSTRTAVLGAVFCLLSLTSVILGHQVIRRRRCDER